MLACVRAWAGGGHAFGVRVVKRKQSIATHHNRWKDVVGSDTLELTRAGGSSITVLTVVWRGVDSLQAFACCSWLML